MKKSKIRVAHLFESYPIFYQPYMPLFEKLLGEHLETDLDIVSYKVSSDDSVISLPSYYKRKLYEKFYHLIKSEYKELNYFEIFALRTDVDIIHIQDSFLFPKVLSLSKKHQKIRPKLIITMRGAETYTKPWVFKKWKDFYKYQKDYIDAFVVMSEHQKEYLNQKWDVALDKINVIPISFGENFQIAAKEPNRKIIKIISVFRLYWAKNISDNLKFIKIIKDLGYKVEYDIYGNGPDIEQVYYLRDKFNLNKEIRIMGQIDNESLKIKLSEYDFLIQLSITESLGMSVIEAQAYGLPAIVSDTDGIVEVILNNESGFVFENFDITIDKVIKLWKNRSEYVKFSKTAIENSHAKYTVNLEVDKTVQLYKRLMNVSNSST